LSLRDGKGVNAEHKAGHDEPGANARFIDRSLSQAPRSPQEFQVGGTGFQSDRGGRGITPAAAHGQR
ncbi:MAG TPA: hypothetical protein VII39_04215, partial [Bradyrhizobium sp.]